MRVVQADDSTPMLPSHE